MPREDRTKYDILNALLELTDEIPFENITVVQICKRACLSRQTFYQHFRDKFDVTTWLLQQLLANSFTELGRTIGWREAFLTEFRTIEGHVRRYPNALVQFTASQDYNAIEQAAIRSSREDFTSCYRAATGREPDALVSYQIDNFATISSIASTEWIQRGCVPPAGEFIDLFITLIPHELFLAMENAPSA